MRRGLARQNGGMPRGLSFLVYAGVLALGVVVGSILNSIWLGVLIALIVIVVLALAFQSKRGRNQGVNDEGNGIEL